MSEGHERYKKPLTTFLNNFCESNRKITDTKKDKFRQNFLETVSSVSKLLGDMSFTVFDDDFNVLSKFNSAVYDSQMVGVRILSEKGILAGLTRKQASEQMLSLFQDPEYVKMISKATSDEKNVKKRIGLFVEAFRK